MGRTAVSDKGKGNDPTRQISKLSREKINAGKLLPEKNVRLWDGRMRRQEGDDGMRIGCRDGGEERSSMEGSSVEKVGRFYGPRILASINLKAGEFWYLRRPDLRV